MKGVVIMVKNSYAGKRVMALTGDYWHNPEMINQSLKQAISLIEEPIELSFITVNQFDEMLKNPPDLFILYKENRIDPLSEEPKVWMTKEREQRLVSFVSNGGSLLAWHTGMAEYSQHTSFVNMLKGEFDFHPKINSVSYFNKGDRQKTELAFTALDEHYFLKNMKKGTDIYLTSTSDEGDSLAGWRHAYDNGFVNCFTPGHTEDVLFNPSFLNLLSDQIKWCLLK